MKHEIRSLTCIAAVLISSLTIIGCSDPMKPDTTTREIVVPPPPLEDCAASAEWLPNTPALAMFEPLPHPTTECPFYRGAWQTFLLAMQTDGTPGGKPALLSYPTIDDTFTTRFKRTARSYLGDIKQAGRREILVDQNGNSIYYGIHVNQAYRQFIADNDLKTSDKLQAYPKDKPNLFFPGGIAEFKTAWQVVEGDPSTIPAQTAGFISMQTTVPTITQGADGTITEDRATPRNVTVRLLAIHVVFTLPGHPEFIWGSFEHSKGTPDSTAKDGMRDVAPTFDLHNPTDNNNIGISMPVDMNNFILYKGGTPVDEANTAIPESSLHLDAAKQKFLNPDGTPEATSIYRMFPASKSNGTAPDDAITSLNNNVQALFAAHPEDVRGHYRLVGAQWMDKPEFFADNETLQNDETSPFAADQKPGIGAAQLKIEIAADGSDSKYSILAGEDRMSSVAMESFTQTGSFQNCFTCHNTRAISSNGISADLDKTRGTKLLDHGLLNVSHVISQFLLEDCDTVAPTLIPDPVDAPIMKAVCPKFVAP
jgi:hypothetical protein